MKLYRALRFVNLQTITFCAAVLSIRLGDGGVHALDDNTDSSRTELPLIPANFSSIYDTLDENHRCCTHVPAASNYSMYNMQYHYRPLSPTYNGCYKDNARNRLLHDKKGVSRYPSLEECYKFCDGYKYLGLEYGNVYYCGDELNLVPRSTYRVPDKSNLCNIQCGSDSNNNCGGDGYISVYQLYT